MINSKTLDEWYKTVNAIYLDRNFYRSLESIYLHFIEVVASLNTAGEASRKKGINAELYLPKALAWFFAFCGRAGIPSIEQMIWAKFPNICPYCRLPEHKGRFCKETDPTKAKIDWNELKLIGEREKTSMPKTISGWQRMFNKIYPRDENTKHEFNIKRMGEECGETAEAIRILPLAPRHIICEAPDIFAWLMGFANQFDSDNKVLESEIGQKLENALLDLYPEGCKDCGFSICKCPAILPSTIGRISKEGPSFDIFQNARGLFSIEDSISFFGLVQQGVKIGKDHFEAKPANYKKFESDLQKIIDKLDSLDSINNQTLVSLTRSFSQLELLARQGMLGQADIDKIIRFIESQPSRTRSTITDFIVNLSASGTFSAMTIAFSEVLKALSK